MFLYSVFLGGGGRGSYVQEVVRGGWRKMLSTALLSLLYALKSKLRNRQKISMKKWTNYMNK